MPLRGQRIVIRCRYWRYGNDLQKPRNKTGVRGEAERLSRRERSGRPNLALDRLQPWASSTANGVIGGRKRARSSAAFSEHERLGGCAAFLFRQHVSGRRAVGRPGPPLFSPVVVRRRVCLQRRRRGAASKCANGQPTCGQIAAVRPGELETPVRARGHAETPTAAADFGPQNKPMEKGIGDVCLWHCAVLKKKKRIK